MATMAFYSMPGGVFRRHARHEVLGRFGRPLMPLLLFGIVFGFGPAHAQLDRGSSDIRIPDRPITAPGLPPDPMRFLETLGPKPPDEVLKSLNKDLGRSTLEPPDVAPRDRPLAGPRYRPGEDLDKRPPALTTF